MKKYLNSYNITFCFLFVSYFLFSLIFVGIRHFVFISTNYLLIASYILIMISSYLFIQQIPKKRILHACFFACLYALLSFLIGNGISSIIHFVFKPLSFIVFSFLFQLIKKE